MTEQQEEAVPFTFGIDFQRKLIRVLMLGEFAASKVVPHLSATYFETLELRWVMTTILNYYDRYTNVPTWTVLEAAASKLDDRTRPTVLLVLEQLKELDVKDADWVRDNIIGWIRLRIYAQGLRASVSEAKSKKLEKSLEVMAQSIQRIENVVWTPDNTDFFFEEFDARHSARLEAKERPHDTIGTGVDELDEALGGGLSKGEFGVFMGYSKSGKSIFLMNIGANACEAYGAKVYHANYEIKQSLLRTRYETWFARETFSTVINNGLSAQKMKELKESYARMSQRLVLKGQDRFSSASANYKTKEGIVEHLKELEKRHAWRPDLIVVDYADLMKTSGAHKDFHVQEGEKYRALHDLALDGYAVWTVSQANERNVDRSEEHYLLSSAISGSQEKFRCADVYGSINVTTEEAEQGKARIFLENARSHKGGGIIPVDTDLAKMRFGVGVAKKPKNIDPDKAINKRTGL